MELGVISIFCNLLDLACYADRVSGAATSICSKDFHRHLADLLNPSS